MLENLEALRFDLSNGDVNAGQAALDHVESLTADNPVQQDRLKKLKPLLADLAKTTPHSVEYKKGLDTIKPLIDEMEDSKDHGTRPLLLQRDVDANTTALFAYWSIGAAAFIACVVVALVAFFVMRSVNRPVRSAIQLLTSAATEILATTTQQASGAEQAAAVTQTVATVDEVTQTTEQATQRARAWATRWGGPCRWARPGRKAVEDSIAALAKVQEQVETTAQNILALAEQAQAIGDITALVADVAEQTNLLALNAAIEASRAGEHGRGFAVVAGEVKALADQSKKATAQVRQILGEIQKGTNAAVLSTEEVTKGVASAGRVADQAGQTIQALAETLAEASQAATQITASAGQQATGMAQIHQAMRNIDEAARQNLAALRQAEQAAQNLNALGGEFTQLVGK